MKSELVLNNFDARIPNIAMKPKFTKTEAVIRSLMYSPEQGKTVKVNIRFTGVGAIDFRVNFFDNAVGAEVMGLYELHDDGFKRKLAEDIFARRREIYLLEGDYKYDAAEPSDMLNTFDLWNEFSENFDEYHVYIQNVDGGVYVIMAKAFEIQPQQG